MRKTEANVTHKSEIKPDIPELLIGEKQGQLWALKV